MKKCILYSLTIYILFAMSIIIQKPTILCDSNGDFKSWNYFRYKIFNQKIQSPDELICLPTVLILCSLISFILARACIQSSEWLDLIKSEQNYYKSEQN